MKQGIYKGAIAGLLAWLTYGVIEFALACGLPAIAKSEVLLRPWQWPMIALLFAFYAVCGMLFGAAGGAILTVTADFRDEKSYEISAALTLALAFSVNLLGANLSRYEKFALGMACILAALFIAALCKKTWQRPSEFLATGWVVSLLLLIGPWLSRDVLKNNSGALKTGALLGALAAIIALAALAHRMRTGNEAGTQRKVLTATSVLAVAALALFSGRTPLAQAAATAKDRPPSTASVPNVVLITMDTVRADHLSVYGYERKTSPRLEEFAREATVYTRAIAASDMTLPSHASMFTGLYSSWHGANTSHRDYPYGRPLPPEAVTLSEILRGRGYWTGAVVANHSFLQAGMGLGQGFTVWDHHMASHLSAEEQPFYLREGARRVLSLLMDTSEFDGYFLRGSDINQRAFSLLESVRNRGPFFLFLNYMDAHIPYVPPQPFRGAFPGRDERFLPAAEHQALTNAINRGKRHVSESERRHLVSQYDGGIAYEDSQVGALLTRLKETGLYDNTLILITSDHGEAFGERDLMQHGTGSVYQDAVQVPLLVKYPAQHEGLRSDALASHVDILPTVLDLAGIAPPQGISGRSLRNSRTDEDAVFAEAWAIGKQDANPRLRGARRAIYAGGWKLIVWTAGQPELYDLAADPAESRNLYQSGDPRAAELTKRISAWIASIPNIVVKPGKVDKSTLDRIRGLGYTQ
jgi:arylsulfatase A-like enzyme